MNSPVPGKDLLFVLLDCWGVSLVLLEPDSAGRAVDFSNP